MQNEYDIKKIMEEIELQLISSMKRTLWSHNEDEKAKGFDWPQWQALKIKQFEDYKNVNKGIFNNNTKALNKYLYKHIKQQFREGASRTNKKAIQSGFIKKEDSQLGGSFFGLNHRKLDALIKSTKNDMKDVKYATLRMANDQYRQIIYKAQVFANTGAGTVKQAIDMASKDFLTRGFNCIEYKNGTRHNIADYCDMAIRTANKRANLMGAGEMRKKLGNSLVYVSKHGGACDKCTPWEGRVYIDDVWSGGTEKNGEYPLLSTAIEGGLFHPRCHHGVSTYYEDINDEPEEVTKAKHSHDEEDKYTQYLQQRQKQCERLAIGSLLPENVLKYQNKANELKNRLKNDNIEENKALPEFKSLLKSQLQIYTKKELKQIAKETKEVVSKYTINKSKWSGKIIESKRRITAKLWNCNIEVENLTSPHQILHEQLHAHSISYFNKEIYKQYNRIEEATVELYTKEICKKENIVNIESEYDDWVNNLKKINEKINIEKDNFLFARKLFNIPVTKRLEFLENEIDKYLKDKTVDEAIELNTLMEVLYVK